MVSRDNVDVIMVCGIPAMVLINKLVAQPHHNWIYWALVICDVIAAIAVAAWFAILRPRWRVAEPAPTIIGSYGIRNIITVNDPDNPPTVSFSTRIIADGDKNEA